MKVLIVRHAESANNVLSMVSYELYMSSRSSDPNLTEAGILQAEKVGKFFKDNGFRIDKSILTINQFSLVHLIEHLQPQL